MYHPYTGGVTTQWLTGDQERTWRAFVRMHGQLAARLNRQLGGSGLSLADYEVLVQLTDATDVSLTTSSAAVSVHPPWKTDNRLNTFCSRSLSSA